MNKQKVNKWLFLTALLLAIVLALIYFRDYFSKICIWPCEQEIRVDTDVTPGPPIDIRRINQ